MPNTDDFRVKRIQQLLLEMAKGNFFHSLEPSEENDTVAALVVMLNMVNEEIRASFLHQGFANAGTTPQYLVQLSLLLDAQGTIEMANNKACALLSRMPKDTIGRPLTDLLTERSRKKWNKKRPQLLKKDPQETVLNLELQTAEGLLIHKDFQVSVLRGPGNGDQKILLDTVFFSTGEPVGKAIWKNPLKVGKGPKEPKVRLSHEDIHKMRSVHDMIVGNPQNDLPRLRDLALQIGTNEFKLKYGFKQLYGTTIFKFLIQERLRKAKTLIQYTSLSIKTIAHMTGFKSMPHFSRAFKEKYGCSPSALRT